MRRLALIIILIFFAPIYSGCLTQSENVNVTMNENNGTSSLITIPNYREPIIGGSLPINLDESQIKTFERIITKHRGLNEINTTVPREGGNWTHYFVCSDGEKIDYVFPMPNEFTCPKSGEKMSGQQYESSWTAFRHRALIREIGLNSAISYYLTNYSEDGQLAKKIILEYSKFYTSLPIQDRFGVEGDFGGRLTRQSLDEAVLLTELSWMHYLIKPILTAEQDSNITTNLILPMVDVLNTPSNQNRDSLSNWFSFHNAAIAMAAVSTNNSSLLQQSLTQSNGLYHQLDNGFDEDGFWHEGSIAYHNYTLTAMAMNIEAAKHFHVDIDNYTWQTQKGREMQIQAPFVAHLSLVKPDGTFPRLNDDIQGVDLISVLDLLEFANRYWPESVPNRQLEQARAMSEHISIKSALRMTSNDNYAAKLSSLNLESFGVSIIRQNDIFLLVDYGPHGGWHGHYDKLNVEIISGNSTLIEDPGTVVYSLPSSSEWYRTSIAHSLPFVGFQNQPAASGALLFHEFSINYSTLMVQYTDEAIGMNITRTLLVLDTEEYGELIIDVSRWSGITPQIATQTYHFTEAEPVYGNNRSASLNVSSETKKYIDVGRWDELDENQQDRIIRFSSGDNWDSFVHVMSENEIYSGTSVNGGTMVIQSSKTPLLNSTMVTIHRISNESASTGDITFQVNHINNGTIIGIGDLEISIDWSSYRVNSYSQSI